MTAIESQRAVQNVAKKVLNDIAPTLNTRDTESTIAKRAVALMRSYGVTETWYYACPAFVLLGSRSKISQSGRHYQPSSGLVGALNLVTIDLSPLKDGLWGDYARSFCIEDGKWVAEPTNIDLSEGLRAEQQLHQSMRAFVTPATTFDALYQFANLEIESLGFENSNFVKNLGHSIVQRRDDRIYIESGNQLALGAVKFFTFEPHIAKKGCAWGFKHEDIYFFDAQGRLEVL